MAPGMATDSGPPVSYRGAMSDGMTQAEADAFVAAWMEAWNSHDAGRIAAHYRDDVEYESPFVASLTPGGHGLVGRDAVRGYIEAALTRYPYLHFDAPMAVAVGAGSVSFVYRSVNDLLAVETLVLDDDHLVTRALCHYTAAPPVGSALGG